MGKRFKNIRNTSIISPGCRERFLPLRGPATKALRDLDLMLSGISDLADRYEVARRAPRFHLVLFTLAGRGQLTSPSCTTSLRKGDLLIAPAGGGYSYHLASRTWKILWFHFEDGETWRAFRSRETDVLKRDCDPNLIRVMEGLLAEGIQDQEASGRAAELFAELIALYLKRELNPDADPRGRAVRARLFALWEQVNANLKEHWTVAELARRFHASPIHFHRLAVQYGGARPMEMVTRLRMQRAQELLLGQDLSIQQIAEAVGYGSPFAFSVAFKRYAGMNPRMYRKRGE